MTIPADPYRDWDVAYVLGSLSPAGRREFESHFDNCPACAANVSTLAGMPGILSAVSDEHAIELLEPASPVPGTAFSELARAARLSRRWRRVRFTAALVGTAAASVAVALALQPERGGSRGFAIRSERRTPRPCAPQ